MDNQQSEFKTWLTEGKLSEQGKGSRTKKSPGAIFLRYLLGIFLGLLSGFFGFIILFGLGIMGCGPEGGCDGLSIFEFIYIIPIVLGFAVTITYIKFKGK